MGMERFADSVRAESRVLDLDTAVEDCQCCHRTWTALVAERVVVDPNDRLGGHTTLLS